MVTRTQCLYRDKIIGIETIYTVIDGKQINIPEKLADLRQKSRNNELFCPCGCGSNLILVAGEHNLREQHFRLKENNEALNCTYVSEGEVSINSKVILKCWLDDKLKADDIASRVPISGVDETKRRCEFSFLSLSRGVGVNYSREKENVTDDKLDVLARNSRGIHLIHVVDIFNLNMSGQFPEFLAKIQERQGYCLFLDSYENDYFKSCLTAAVYRRNLDGLWEQILLATDKISNFEIGSNGEPVYLEKQVLSLAEEKISLFDEEQELLRQQREIAKAKAEKDKARREAQAEKKREEREEERLRKLAEENRIQKEDAENGAFKKQQEAEKEKRCKEFQSNLSTMQFGKMNIVCDPYDNRLYICSYCGKIGYEKEFYTYQGSKGICYDCDKNSQKLKEKREEREKARQEDAASRQKPDPKICPECGKRLIERYGPSGRFIGCAGFPRCRYTRSSWHTEKEG